MSTEENRSRKRPFGSSSSTTATAEPHLSPEPPRHRSRLTSTQPSFHYETTQLQAELDDLRASLEHERTLRQLDARKFQQTQTRLERQIEFATEETRETKALLEDAQDKADAHICQLRQTKTQLLKQLRQAQAELAETQLQAASEQPLHHLRASQETLQQQLQHKDEEIELLQSQLAQVVTNERNKTTPVKTPEKQVKPPEDSVSPAPKAVLKELNRVRLALQQTEREYRQLQRQSDDWHSKALLLPQQREASRSATARLSKLESELGELRVQHERLQATHASWSSFDTELRSVLGLPSTKTTTTIQGPPEVASVLRRMDASAQTAQALEQKTTQLEQTIQKQEAAMATLQRTLEEKDLDALQLQKEKIALQEEWQRSQRRVETLEAQEGIWRREADSLRALLQTYDHVLPGTKDSTNAGATGLETKSLQVSLQTARDKIKVLEQERDDYKAELEPLRRAHAELSKKHGGVVEKFGRLREALQTERDKVAEAQQRAARAETLAGRGSFNADETRVLHLSKNPLSEAVRTKYEGEIRALRRQLQEATGDKGKAPPPSSGTTEVDPNKLHQRLKESFKEQISLFREGVYLMTGYKVDMLPGEKDRPTFRVRSVYAEQEQDHLMFVWPKGDEVTSLDLVETDLAKQLAATDSYQYMVKFNSLPSFLASVQLSLFEKQTFIGS